MEEITVGPGSGGESATASTGATGGSGRRLRPPAWLRPHARWIAAVVMGLLGAWAALVVAGTTHAFVGPLAVDASVRPALSGESIVEVDPIGTLVLDTHRAPVSLQVSVRSVDVDGIREIVSDPASLTQLDDRIVEDIQDVLVEAAVRAAVVAVLGAVVAAGLVLRSVRHTLLAAATTAGALVVSFGSAALTYNPDAVREAHYTGLLEAAPQLVGSAEDIASNFDAYAEQLAALVTNVGALYDTTLSLPSFRPTDDTIRALHVSDLHLNPAAWDLIGAVAEQYDVDVIIDTGDIADHGTVLENNYVQPISGLGRPYVFVKGNHDSVATAAAVAAQPNAVVVDREPVEVAGLRFFGAPDPRFTADKTTRGTTDEAILEGSEELAELAGELEPPADVLLFHDPTHAELFDGTAPLVLSGHAHKRSTTVLDDGTRVMVQGSTGGAGLRALQNEEPTPVTLSVLYFDDESKELLAWDDITLGGIGLTSAQIERSQADEDDDSAEPAPEDTSEPTGTPVTPPPATTTAPTAPVP